MQARKQIETNEPLSICTLNPARLSRKDRVIMRAFLLHQQSLPEGTRFFPANTNLPLNGQTDGPLAGFTHIQFTNDIIKTTCSSDPADCHYDIIDSQVIDQGASGSMRKIIGRMKITDDQALVCKPMHDMIAKFFSLPVQPQKTDKRILSEQINKFKDSVINEYELLARDEDYRAKKPTFYATRSNMHAVLTMRYLPGMNFSTLFAKIKSGELVLSAGELAEIAARLARGLDKLHNHHRILHRDIKPENIMVYFIHGVWKIKYIDFGLSCSMEAVDHKRAGTPLYASPEVFDDLDRQLLIKPLTTKSDVFSLAWELAFLFGAKNEQPTKMMEAVEIARHCQFIGVCEDIEMRAKNKARIIEILQTMAKREQSKRPDPDVIADFFDRISLSIMKETLSKEEKQRIRQVYQIIDEWRKQQTLFVTSILQSGAPLRDYLAGQVGVLKAALTQLGNDDISILVCLKLLDMDVLYGLKSKEAMVNKLETLTHSYLKHLDKLTVIQGEAKKLLASLKGGQAQCEDPGAHQRFISALQAMDRRIGVVMDKNACLMTFDDIVKRDARCQKYIRRFEYELFTIKAATVRKTTERQRPYALSHQDKGEVSRQGLFSQKQGATRSGERDRLLRQASHAYAPRQH